MSEWTDSEITILMAGLEAGDSAQLISDKLPGRTRCSVLGKLRRMGISKPRPRNVARDGGRCVGPRRIVFADVYDVLAEDITATVPELAARLDVPVTIIRSVLQTSYSTMSQIRQEIWQDTLAEAKAHRSAA